MNDPMMTKILQGFNDVETKTTTLNESAGEGAVTMRQDPMLSILKSFDNVESTETVAEEAGINSGPGAHYKPYLPGKKKMGKSTDSKHPAKAYIVGGADGEPDAGEEVVAEEEVEEDTISKKQSFSDILRSMDEADEERASRLKTELHDELNPQRKMERNEKGTYDLSENGTMNIKREIYAELKSLAQLVGKCKDEQILGEVYEAIMEAQYSIGANMQGDY